MMVYQHGVIIDIDRHNDARKKAYSKKMEESRKRPKGLQKKGEGVGIMN
jgi:hypothetical protein